MLNGPCKVYERSGSRSTKNFFEDAHRLCFSRTSSSSLLDEAGAEQPPRRAAKICCRFRLALIHGQRKGNYITGHAEKYRAGIPRSKRVPDVRFIGSAEQMRERPAREREREHVRQPLRACVCDLCVYTQPDALEIPGPRFRRTGSHYLTKGYARRKPFNCSARTA